MQRKINVLLIEDSGDFAALVQRWLVPQDGTDFVVTWRDSLMGGLDVLARGGMDVVLLDLGLPDSKGFDTFTKASTQAHGVPIVILSGDDKALALQMVREGAQDYVIKTACTCDMLSKALLYAVERSGRHTTESDLVGEINLWLTRARESP